MYRDFYVFKKRPPSDNQARDVSERNGEGLPCSLMTHSELLSGARLQLNFILVLTIFVRWRVLVSGWVPEANFDVSLCADDLLRSSPGELEEPSKGVGAWIMKVTAASSEAVWAGPAEGTWKQLSLHSNSPRSGRGSWGWIRGIPSP